MSPAEVVDQVVRSGLGARRGRLPDRPEVDDGGQGLRDAEVRDLQRRRGRPGAFMDRSVLESDPHRVLEGMAIAGYAVGASRGYVYCRAEYPLAVARLKTAIRLAGRAGLLGAGIADTPSSSRSSCAWARARSSAARRRPCWPRSRAGGAPQGPGRRTRPSPGCGRARR